MSFILYISLTFHSRKRINRRSSGPFVNTAEKLEWRHRTVSLPLRPPRQMSVSEADDGCLKLDSSSYRLLCQDLNGVKTLLLRLKSVIQEVSTLEKLEIFIFFCLRSFYSAKNFYIIYSGMFLNSYTNTYTSLLQGIKIHSYIAP